MRLGGSRSRRRSECGSQRRAGSVAIGDLNGDGKLDDALHRTIAAEVIRKPARLSGPELVFLRSELGMSARKLSKTIGVVHESISRWENDVLPVSPTADRLLRTMIALTTEGEKFPVETRTSKGTRAR